MIRKIRWRLTFTYLIVIFAAMSILGLLLSYSIEHQFVSEAETALNAHGELLRSRIEESFRDDMKPGDLDDLCRLLGRKVNAHIVVYGQDGILLGDSDSGLAISATDVSMPRSMKELREGLGCRICHSEARATKMMTIEVPIMRGNPARQAGTLELSASLYEAQRAAAKTRRIILVTLVFTSLIAAAMTLRLAGSIAGPIRRMNDMAQRIASGDLSQRVRTDAKDEVGHLAKNLNVMADRLQANLDQLAEEKNKMETIFATMADGIVVMDKSGIITLFNRASERLFGLASNRMVGESADALASVPDLPGMIRRMLDSGNPIRKELRTAVPAERVINVYAAPVHDRKGDIAGGVIVLQDVTESRRQSKIRKDFVANVSHELRTPVASIRAIAGALQSGGIEDPSVAGRFLNNLEAEAERLSLLLTDLLNLSELESGKKQPKRAPVLLAEVAREAVVSLSGTARRCGVSVLADIPPEISVYADQRQMLQILQNLIDNAVKYTGEGGRVEITGHETAREISVTVKDTGVGIPPADLDRIFERFYRADKARSRQLGGTGLGLSIVKDIVEAHNGRITVESQVGQGSEFTITLPKTQPEIGSDAG